MCTLRDCEAILAVEMESTPMAILAEEEFNINEGVNGKIPGRKLNFFKGNFEAYFFGSPKINLW